MYRLRMLSNGVYQIHSHRSAFEGTRDAVKIAAQEFGILRSEFEFAAEDLEEKNNNCAEFGVSGIFLFSKRIA